MIATKTLKTVVLLRAFKSVDSGAEHLAFAVKVSYHHFTNVLILQEICGDSIIVGFETCDDGNNITGDGCDSYCKIDPAYKCLRPGRSCVSTSSFFRDFLTG